MLPVKRNILLNPGPATTTDTVKLAQVVPDICPRETEFGNMMEYVSTELTRFIADPNEYTAVLLGGSGTAAVESILSSVIDDGAVVIINNGAYGKRMCEIAGSYGMNFIEFPSAPDEPVDLEALDALFENLDCKISHLAVVHHETTTGLLNDVPSIGELCRRRKVDLIVDAMSSYGAIPIRMEPMNISYLAASSNKNLQGIAGISFVIAGISKLDGLAAVKRRNYYLNLYDQYRVFEQTRQMRFTPPVQTIYALKQAIEELKEEGLEARFARYAKSWETLIEGITRLGLKHLVPREHHSKILTSIIEPDFTGYDFQDMHDYLYERGFTIYPGKLAQLNTFRVANIGAITYKDIEAFLAILESYFEGCGYPLRKAEAP